MYHVTQSDRVEQILRDGLETDRPGCYAELAVYLFSRFEDADLFGVDNYAGEEYTILTVDAEGLKMDQDTEYPEGTSWMVRESISPERIAQ